MALYNCQCKVRPNNEPMVHLSPDQLATWQPIPYSAFFKNLVVTFYYPYFPNQQFATRHTFELFFPPYDASDQNINVWDAAIHFMYQVGVPDAAISQAFYQLLMFDAAMARERGNRAHNVLPLDGFIVLTISLGEVPLPLPVTIDEVCDDQVLVDCSICLQEMVVGTIVGRLPCMHFFHEKCVNDWLVHGRSCPTCRFQLG